MTTPATCPRCLKTFCNKNYVEKHHIERCKGPIVLRQDEEFISESASSAHTIDGRDSLPVYDYDINDCIGGPCVYVLHLVGNDYKFGVSGEIDVRTEMHMADFRKDGVVPKCVKMWKCESMQIMKDVEMKIKRLAKQLGILCARYGKKKEIIRVDNIDPIIERINKYVADMNRVAASTLRIRELEVHLALVEAINAGKRLDLEIMRLRAGMTSDFQ